MSDDDTTTTGHDNVWSITTGRPATKQKAHDRQNQALQLRLAGATYDEIATALGYNDRQMAYNSVRVALKREDDSLAKQREEYRALTLARSDRLIRGLWVAAAGGDVAAVDRVVALMNRQAKLLGLDAPVQVTVTEDTAASIAGLLTELEHLVIPGEVEEDAPMTAVEAPWEAVSNDVKPW